MTVTNDNGYDYVDKLNIEGELYNVADTAAREAIDDITPVIADISSTVDSLESSKVDFNGTNTYGSNAVNIFPDDVNLKIGKNGVSDNLRNYVTDMTVHLYLSEFMVNFGALSANEYISVTSYKVTPPDGKNIANSAWTLLGIMGWYQSDRDLRLTSHWATTAYFRASDSDGHAARSSSDSSSTRWSAVRFGLKNTGASTTNDCYINFRLLWGMRIGEPVHVYSAAPASHPLTPRDVPEIDCPNCDGTDTTCPYWISGENRHMTTREILEFEWLEWHYYNLDDDHWYELRTGNSDPVTVPWYVQVDGFNYTYDSHPH